MTSSEALREGDVPPRGQVGARRLVGAASAGVLVSGLMVNVYLAVVARALPPGEYAAFGAFWALALVLGFGAFLPLEQALAGELPRPQDRRALLRAAGCAAAVLSGLALVLLALTSPAVLPALHNDPSALIALAALCVVSGVQFLLRGTLIGSDRLVRHAAVMVLDAVLRLGLAIAVFLLGGADAAAFCWALVVAILVSHLPQLPGALRRAIQWSPDPSTWGRPARVRSLTTAAMPLLVGSVCAQLLLNGLPVLVVALSDPMGDVAAGVFVAAFTLAKAPLSMVVPLQSAVVPTLTRLIAAGRRREVLVVLLRGAALLAAAAAVGVPLAMWIGPDVVTLVFGADYVIGGTILGVIVGGVLAHIGLVIVTQVHVARARHGDVALSWLTGLVAAGVTFSLITPPVFAGAVAFLVGSVSGGVASCAILALARRRSNRSPSPNPTRSTP